MKTLGIIPARKNSKRVPQKNFRPFAGTTLTDLAIQQALNANSLDVIAVNSDSEEVLRIAAKYEQIIAINRPGELASDDSPAIDYMLHTLNFFKQQKLFFDYVVIIQPSSPFRKGSDIDATVNLLSGNNEADSAVSVVRLPQMIHPHKIKLMEGNILKPWLVVEGENTAAHQLPELYVRNCAVYVFRAINLEKHITFGEVCLGYLMPPETSVDINDMREFEFAEYIYLK
jgi:CMP-N-acetylneuraminic acid synthetase